MSTREARIAPGCRVRLHLSLHLDDGTEVLSTFGHDPLAFRIGDGTLAEGLESLLMELPVGTDTQLLADGSAIYGAPNPALIQILDHRDMPPAFSATPGEVIHFQTPGGQEAAGTVLEEIADGLRVDFNHPLSRRGLKLRVKVLDVSG